jgi:hypothetical protein
MEDVRNAVNSTITIKGHISNVQWQHLIKYDHNYPIISYLDLEDSFQIVLYSKTELPKDKELLLKGKVIQIHGSSKRPGETKVDETYSEYQFVVEEILNH